MTDWWDEPHGISNDVFDVMKHFKLFPYILTLLVLFSLPHGLDKEKGLRMAQLKQAEQLLFKVLTPEDCASFQARLAELMKEVQARLCTGAFFDCACFMGHLAGV